MIPNSRPRIAVVHAALLGGGAEAVTLWGIQALTARYDVTFITLLPVDLASIDAFYGTSLASRDFKVVSIFSPGIVPNWLFRNLSLFTFRQHLLSVYVKRLEGGFDLVVSTFNEMDMGRRSIQYIHAPTFSPYSSAARKALRFPDSSVRRMCKGLSAALFGVSDEMLAANVSITNSAWTAALLKDACEIDASVMYPPVLFANGAGLDWEKRRNGFVCVGRFVREKKIEDAIAIVERVRSMGVDVTLHVVGRADDRAYFRSLAALLPSRVAWLTLEQDAGRARLADLMGCHKYGIHTREAEQFGIGVAEMAAFGCVPFVPRIGGQAEIVAGDQRLTFDDIPDAAQKIHKLMSSASEQEDVRANLARQKQRFSTHRFMAEFELLVQRSLLDPALGGGAPAFARQPELTGIR